MSNNQATAQAPPPPPAPAASPAPLPPYTRADITRFFTDNVLRNEVFSYLNVTDASNLRNAVHAKQQLGGRLTIGDYLMCTPRTCEDVDARLLPARPAQRQPNAPQPLPFEPPNFALVPCTREAKYRNYRSNAAVDANGDNELSVCRESSDLHADARHRLVCYRCKLRRFFDLQRRHDDLQYGICATCRTWANTNLPLNPQSCACEVFVGWTNGHNSHEYHGQHLCRDHDEHFWATTSAAAQAEMDARRQLRLRKKRKLSHYRRKGRDAPKTAWDALSPQQRRARMKWDKKARVSAVPNCYCGNVMTAADRARLTTVGAAIAAGMQPPLQWRSCTGCSANAGGGFVCAIN